MFQFYLSSIKSGSVQGGSSFSSEFQFYLSSIKRRLELVVIRLLRSFNSTLVQLKVIEGINKNNTSAGFNSTLVQLKDADHFRFSQWEKKFQFYLSSIKSLSTERWFECLHMFQFYLSSIKRISGMPSRQPLIGFNSTLVQLKDSQNQWSLDQWNRFQFYLSSIKRVVFI